MKKVVNIALQKALEKHTLGTAWTAADINVVPHGTGLVALYKAVPSPADRDRPTEPRVAYIVELPMAAQRYCVVWDLAALDIT